MDANKRRAIPITWLLKFVIAQSLVIALVLTGVSTAAFATEPPVKASAEQSTEDTRGTESSVEEPMIGELSTKELIALEPNLEPNAEERYIEEVITEEADQDTFTITLITGIKGDKSYKVKASYGEIIPAKAMSWQSRKSINDGSGPIRLGYLFTGWHKGSKTGTLVNLSEKVTLTEDTKLYATWKKATASKIAADIAKKAKKKKGDLYKIMEATKRVNRYVALCTYGNAKYYNQPKGVFVKGVYTCAGSTSALGLVLKKMGYKWKHVHKTLWTHRWNKISTKSGTMWADAMAGAVGYGAYAIPQKLVEGAKLPSNSSITKLTIPDQTWTGKQIKPKYLLYKGILYPIKGNVTVKKYGKNKNVGKGTITIRGKGSIKGTRKVSFNIIPQNINTFYLDQIAADQMKLSWKPADAPKNINGYQLRYLKGDTSTWTKKKYDSSITSIIFEGIRADEGYYIMLRTYKTVGGKNHYSEWLSGMISVDSEWHEDDDGFYDDYDDD